MYREDKSIQTETYVFYRGVKMWGRYFCVLASYHHTSISHIPKFGMPIIIIITVSKTHIIFMSRFWTFASSSWVRKHKFFVGFQSMTTRVLVMWVQYKCHVGFGQVLQLDAVTRLPGFEHPHYLEKSASFNRGRVTHICISKRYHRWSTQCFLIHGYTFEKFVCKRSAIDLDVFSTL